VLVAALLFGAACGSSDPVAFAATGAWSRPTPGAATSGVVYLIVTSDRADEIRGVDVPASVADHAEMHTTSIDDGGGLHDHSADDGSGLATMEELDAVPIAAGGSVVFEPGGNHIMLIDLVEPLRRGESFPVTIRFASGRELDVDVAIADNPPST
jgi:copper(I)-binding protein